MGIESRRKDIKIEKKRLSEDKESQHEEVRVFGIYSWVLERLFSFGDSFCFIGNDETYTYDCLQREVYQWQRKLDELDIQPGQVIGVVVREDFSCLVLFLVLLLNRNILVPLSEDVAEYEEKWSISGVEGYFDTPNCKWVKRSPSVCPSLITELQKENDGGVVIFTSGTTGTSKAALLQTKHILRKFEEMRRPWRSLIFLKLDHIGGIHTLLSIWLNGGCMVCSKERSVEAVCQAIEKHKIELLPATPSFLNMLLLSSLYRKHDLSSLKMITYGTEPMPHSTLKALHALFPEVKLKQTYGLTELDIFNTQSKNSDSNWMKIAGEGVSLQVRDGELWIRSQGAMRGYLNAPSPFDNLGWYNTGDRVEKKGEYYRILGRVSDMINVGGEKVYPVEVESVLLKMPYVQDVKVEGKSNPIMGQVVCATFVLEREESVIDLRKRMKAFCLDCVEPFKIPVVVQISKDSLMGYRFKKQRIKSQEAHYCSTQG
ncbi:MAG: AMP-binding protein [Kiritimatiellae bacterium]|nr:AMP-binding protein [Kiritimatiellia bacterium]